MKLIRRKTLHKALLKRLKILKSNTLFITSFRVLSRDLLEIELAQKKFLGHRTLVGSNIIDDNNSSDEVLLFNYLFIEPNELLPTFPELTIDSSQLMDLIKDWYNDDVDNTHDTVACHIHPIKKIYTKKNKILTPTISVTEFCESQIQDFEYWTNELPEHDDVNEIIKEYHFSKNINFLKTEHSDEYILDRSSGDKIYRYTRIQFVEDKPKDIIIKNKLTESDYNLFKSETRKNNFDNNRNKNETYLFFDTETTGLPNNFNAPITDLDNWPRMVQLAYILTDNRGNKISTGNFLIKPKDYSIPISSTNIHGISNESAIKNGYDISKALNIFCSIIEKADFLISHNFDFDEKILGAELLRNKIYNPIPKKHKICTMKKTTNLCAINNGSKGYKWPKLSDLYYKLFKDDFYGAHNAENDVEALTKCFWELRKLKKI
ncbi:3'-5' exonuclease [Galbibacter mesophilus]|uniref:3'-5' exonuclease n=1 Tax=Galbibacter mesophilus TaxID=379069 RepID=UPI00191E6A27|nr:3'-5' exonuclease [Galbibacter mesophilus]MCM5663768.1 3'-5' exonuclease [Galbibacter mesophilus]